MAPKKQENQKKKESDKQIPQNTEQQDKNQNVEHQPQLKEKEELQMSQQSTHSLQKQQEEQEKNQSSQIEQNSIKQTENQKNSSQSKSDKSSKVKLTFYQALIKSKFLKATYKHFCSLTHTNTKKTFDQMIKQIQMMSLSKWMIFCKEFQLSKIIQFDKRVTQFKNNQNAKTLQSVGSSDLSRTKRKYSQIPVKQINRIQIKIANIYKKFNQNSSRMTYNTFVKAIEYISQLYVENFKQINENSTEFMDRQTLQNKFKMQILAITDERMHKHKMANLKVQFKGSLSYYHETKLPEQKPNNHKLVSHGGRLSEQVHSQLQNLVTKKKQVQKQWIESQPQNISIYSKSRVCYKAEQKKGYQTNDVIRMARNQTQQQQQLTLRALQEKTRLIDDKLSLKHKGVMQTFQRNVQKNTFGSIFQDKTNTFAQKIDRMKNFYLHKQSNLKLKQFEQNDDQILKMHFENQKRIYGKQNGKKTAKTHMSRSRVAVQN